MVHVVYVMYAYHQAMVDFKQDNQSGFRFFVHFVLIFSSFLVQVWF